MLLLGLIPFVSVSSKTHESAITLGQLQAQFKNPPQYTKPYARWWWNGNVLEASEIDRQLQLLRDAGFGGVEVTPILMPEYASPKGDGGLTWLSPDWCEMLEYTVDAADRLGLAVELIAGTGWPFGGEDVPIAEQTQKIDLRVIPIPTGERIEIDMVELFTNKQLVDDPHFVAPEPLFAYIAPQRIESLDDLTNRLPVKGQTRISIAADRREPRQLILGAIQTGISIKSVTYAAPGNSGPVLDHFDQKAVEHYFARIKRAFDQYLEPRFASRLEALFVDSVELSGSNWTDDIESVFAKRRGYDIRPYLPFIAHVNDYAGYPADQWDFSSDFQDEIKRVRYDFNYTLAQLLKERFILPFHQWCHEMGTQSKYQPYGMPWLFDMIEGGMIPDIPESNNWVFSDYPYYHGFRAWNKYTSSAAHITGKQRVSCESMTNGGGVFRTTLDRIKRDDDLNFVMGMNHAVVHGYNYSPETAGFPGWIRFGTYFSEHNTWWDYLPNWTTYHARLSSLFRNTKPKGEIAILVPQADIWGDFGLARGAFQTTPYYANQLWEPLQQIGYSVDYVNERLVREASVGTEGLQLGKINVSTLILCDVRSMQLETLETLESFVDAGGTLIWINSTPAKVPEKKNNDSSDELLATKLETLMKDESVHLISITPKQKPWLHWVQSWSHFLPDPAIVEILNPSEQVFTFYQTFGEETFLFVTNTSTNSVYPTLRATQKKQSLTVWNPETGDIYPMATEPGNSPTPTRLKLEPHQSLLLQIGNSSGGRERELLQPPTSEAIALNEWTAILRSSKGDIREIEIDFNKALPEELQSFSGTVTYHTNFRSPAKIGLLDLGYQEQPTTLRINGKVIGNRWYGEHQYPIAAITPGQSIDIEIELTTTLWNHILDISNHPTAEFFIGKSKTKDPINQTLKTAPILHY